MFTRKVNNASAKTADVAAEWGDVSRVHSDIEKYTGEIQQQIASLQQGAAETKDLVMQILGSHTETGDDANDGAIDWWGVRFACCLLRLHCLSEITHLSFQSS